MWDRLANRRLANRRLTESRGRWIRVHRRKPKRIFRLRSNRNCWTIKGWRFQRLKEHESWARQIRGRTWKMRRGIRICGSSSSNSKRAHLFVRLFIYFCPKRYWDKFNACWILPKSGAFLIPKKRNWIDWLRVR